MSEYVYKNQKKLRCGFTTGTCAAACAQAAMVRLLYGQVLKEVTVQLPGAPKGIRTMSESEWTPSAGVSAFNEMMTRVTLSVYPTEDGGFAIRKDAGDDPDVTNGTEIRAYVEQCLPWPSEEKRGDEHGLSSAEIRTSGSQVQVAHRAAGEQPRIVAPREAFASSDGRLYLTGGVGVGRVKKPGLEQKIGQSAINRVPRQMIFATVQQVLRQFEEAFEESQGQELPDEGKQEKKRAKSEDKEKNESRENKENKEKSENRCYLITISVPEGATLAARTFNPRLGIEGGISILGTTGIVEPMSEAAIVSTIETSIRQALALQVETSERRILAVPGNYGQRYVEENLGLRGMPVVEISNYVGDAIDLAISHGATEFLLVGNIGKLVKLAAGIMNTHSRVADGRWEIFAAHLALAGGTQAQIQALHEATTTEEMLTRLEEMGLRAAVMQSILEAIEQHLAHRIHDKMRFGVIIYSERFGCVGETEDAAALLQEFRSTLDT